MAITTLTDGRDKKVLANRNAIKAALAATDIVSWEEWGVSISNFYSPDGDEIDVYDGRQTYDPQTVYETNEIEDAITDFIGIIQSILDQIDR